MKKDSSFTLSFLDHVALRVKDVTLSAEWYQKVLGLQKYQVPEWGEYPIFLLSGKSGLALFPAKIDDPALDFNSRNVKIDHFAFHVTMENFEKAKIRYGELGLEFQERDHHYFRSIYTKDLDGHVLELTALVVDEKDFYKLPL